MTLSLVPLIFNLGPTELIIILVIVLLLFGGTRLAGLGKSSGRALKEFKEETKDLRSDKSATPEAVAPPQVTGGPVYPPQDSQPVQGYPQQGYPQQGYPQQQGGAQAYPQQAYPQNGQPYTQPQPQPPYGTTPPSNLADPSAPDARRDA